MEITWEKTMRALTDLLENFVITEEDCNPDGLLSGLKPLDPIYSYYMRSKRDRLKGRVIATIWSSAGDDTNWSQMENRIVTKEVLTILDSFSYHELVVKVRSPIYCNAMPFGVCAACFGGNPETFEKGVVGEKVGLAALSALKELKRGPLYARPGYILGQPNPTKIYSRTDGIIRFGELHPGMYLSPGTDYATSEKGPILKLTDHELTAKRFKIYVDFEGEVVEEHFLENEAQLFVTPGCQVVPGMPLYQIHTFSLHYDNSPESLKPVARLLECKPYRPKHLLASIDGITKFRKNKRGNLVITIVPEVGQKRSFEIKKEDMERLRVDDGDLIEAGDELVAGDFDFPQILSIVGEGATAKKILFELQARFEGNRIFIEDRYLELIIGQMLSWIRINDPGETEWAKGNIILFPEYLEVARKDKVAGMKIQASRTILGVSKVRKRLMPALRSRSMSISNRCRRKRPR